MCFIGFNDKQNRQVRKWLPEKNTLNLKVLQLAHQQTRLDKSLWSPHNKEGDKEQTYISNVPKSGIEDHQVFFITIRHCQEKVPPPQI